MGGACRAESEGIPMKRKLTQIVCDSCKVVLEVEGVTSVNVSLEMQKHGWKLVNSRDLCAWCSKDEE